MTAEFDPQCVALVIGVDVDVQRSVEGLDCVLDDVVDAGFNFWG